MRFWYINVKVLKSTAICRAPVGNCIKSITIGMHREEKERGGREGGGQEENKERGKNTVFGF